LSSSSGEILKHSVEAHAEGLHTAETWYGKVGLSVNPDKTELVFTRKRKIPGFFKPIFSGVILQHSM
jgi:hypothetical protein